MLGQLGTSNMVESTLLSSCCYAPKSSSVCVYSALDARKKARESLCTYKFGKVGSRLHRTRKAFINYLPFINTQLADFAGGSLTCVIGILMALFERTRSVSTECCLIVALCVYSRTSLLLL